MTTQDQEGSGYAKPTATFRLKKQYKTLIATEADAQKRSILKRNLIQAQLASERKEPTKKEGKK